MKNCVRMCAKSEQIENCDFDQTKTHKIFVLLSVFCF